MSSWYKKGNSFKLFLNIFKCYEIVNLTILLATQRLVTGVTKV